jgi:Na+/melibiose symporter-like transporter
VGYRRFFIIGATLIFFTAHALIWLYPQCDGDSEYASTWGLLLIGIGYSFYANVIVAAIPMVVQRKVLGSALGIMEIISSLAECVVPLVTATMIQNSENKEEGFKKSSFFFFLIGLVGVLTSMSLFFIDRKVKKRLDKGEGRVTQPEQLDEIEIPSEYRRIEDEPRSSLPSSFQKLTKRATSAIELSSKQLY